MTRLQNVWSTISGRSAVPSMAAASRGGKPRRLAQVAGIVLAAAIVGFPLLSSNMFLQNLLILSLVGAIGAVSVNIISGYAGYISLGHGAFLGIGAYSAAVIAEHTSLSPFISAPLAGVVAAVLAAGLGVVAMRARGAAFVIITIALSALTLLLAENWTSVTHGTDGMYFPLPTWGLAFQNWPYHFALVGILGLVLLTSWFVRRTKFGLGLFALREDESKAETIGIDTRVYKILGFALSAFFIGMAGAIYGSYLSSILPSTAFSALIGVQFVLAMLIGGTGTLWGPVVGAFVVEIVNEVANNFLGGGNVRLAIYGGVLVAVVLFLPRGALPTISDWTDRMRTRGRPAEVGARLGESAVVPLFTTSPRAMGEHDQDPPALLEVCHVAKQFGELKVLRDCSFAVPQGSISGLIGPNGSGKTTLFNIVDGSMKPNGGEILFGGRDITSSNPWERSHAGIARTYQITRLFKNLTVRENLVAPSGRTSLRTLAAGAVAGDEIERAQYLLDFVGMSNYLDARAGSLSYGQQKLVELAQILMLEPKLILLDEPGAGINPKLIDRLAEMIIQLNKQGVSFLIVEHNMPLVLSLCDPVFVLAEGACIAQGHPRDVQADPAVLSAYLGEDFTDALERNEI